LHAKIHHHQLDCRRADQHPEGKRLSGGYKIYEYDALVTTPEGEIGIDKASLCLVIIKKIKMLMISISLA